MLDGLEITIASAVGGVLSTHTTLNLSATAVGAIATVYLAGEVAGALFFGWLSDRLGRRNFFVLTLGVYLVGNLAGPLTIGRLFDTVGRKKMIAGTYLLSGAMLAVTAYLFNAGTLNAATQTIAWCVIFLLRLGRRERGLPHGQ